MSHRSRRIEREAADAILRALASRAHAAHFRVLVGVLSRYSEALLFARRTRRPRLFEGEAELRGLHAREQGLLLCEAAEIALARSGEGRLWTAPLQPLPRVEDWGERCAEEVDCAVAGGRGVAGELLACGLGPPEVWPPPLELIRASLRLHPCGSSRLVLARIRFAAGFHEEARARYRGLLLARLPGCRRAQLREALAIACELGGDAAAALDHFETASALGAGERAHLGAWIAAVELGLEDRAASALDRLLGEWPDAGRLQRSVREARERRELAGRAVDEPVAARLRNLDRALAGRAGAGAGR